MKRIFLILLILLTLNACDFNQYRELRSGVVSIGVSSDGRYAITAHHGKLLYLWDLIKKNKTLLSDDANLYSAAFIKNTHQYLWQDIKNNVVYIRDIDNKKQKHFKLNYPSYGHHMNQAGVYTASTENWELHQWSKGKDKIIKHVNPKYSSRSKLLDISSDEKDRLFLTSGRAYYKGEVIPLSRGTMARDIVPALPKARNNSLLNGIVLWNQNSGNPLDKFIGAKSMTHAILSPDGHYVVSGDENSLGFVWDAISGKRIQRLDSILFGRWPSGQGPTGDKFDSTGLIKPPKDFCQTISDYECMKKYQTNAMRFISNTQYLRFTEGVPYAILYDINSPKARAYLPLGKTPDPDVYGYTVSARIATAPKAGILVMAQSWNKYGDQNKSSGIIVYQFDNKTKSLKKIWAPDGPLAHKVKKR